MATGIGMGGAKRMIWDAINYPRRSWGEKEPSNSWFTEWLMHTKELHIIKSKPITQHRTEILSRSPATGGGKNLFILERWPST
jgi:hypothetical protein